MAPTPIYADLPPNDSINITTQLLDGPKKNTTSTALKLLNDVDLALTEFARLNSSITTSSKDFLETFFRNPKVCAIISNQQ